MRPNIATSRSRRASACAPERMADYLALRGDSVDNMPGVPGVGPKTAAALMSLFATLEELFEGLERIVALPLRGAAALPAAPATTSRGGLSGALADAHRLRCADRCGQAATRRRRFAATRPGSGTRGCVLRCPRLRQPAAPAGRTPGARYADRLRPIRGNVPLRAPALRPSSPRPCTSRSRSPVCRRRYCTAARRHRRYPAAAGRCCRPVPADRSETAWR